MNKRTLDTLQKLPGFAGTKKPLNLTTVVKFHYGDRVKGRFHSGVIVHRPADADPGICADAVWVLFDGRDKASSHAPFYFLEIYGGPKYAKMGKFSMAAFYTVKITER